jgi:hypothetical protein
VEFQAPSKWGKAMNKRRQYATDSKLKIRRANAPKFAIYVLRAGFSKPAGLPAADELWPEILQRGFAWMGKDGNSDGTWTSTSSFVLDALVRR